MIRIEALGVRGTVWYSFRVLTAVCLGMGIIMADRGSVLYQGDSKQAKVLQFAAVCGIMQFS